MGLFADIALLFTEGYGWIFVILILGWELFAPTMLDRDTAMAPIIRDVPEKVDTLEETQVEIKEDISSLADTQSDIIERQKIGMQVDRAQARANPQMDHDAVDKYLLENGIEPERFLHGNEMSGFSNWEAEDDSDGKPARPDGGG